MRSSPRRVPSSASTSRFACVRSNMGVVGICRGIASTYSGGRHKAIQLTPALAVRQTESHTREILPARSTIDDLEPDPQIAFAVD